MTGRILGLALVAALALAALYISRFWPFEWWSRDGLFGVQELRPQGDLLRRWVRGTPFGAYDLLIWSAGGIVILSLLQSLVDRFRGS